MLPNVTEDFCNKINELNGQNGSPADTGVSAASGLDPGSCLAIGALGRFDDGQQYYTAFVNTTDETTFEQDPNTSAAKTAPQACVSCALDSQRHVYHVLLAR